MSAEQAQNIFTTFHIDLFFQLYLYSSIPFGPSIKVKVNIIQGCASFKRHELDTVFWPCSLSVLEPLSFASALEDFFCNVGNSSASSMMEPPQTLNRKFVKFIYQMLKN